MDHKQRVFQFADNTQKVHELKSKKYNFKIEQILENRFGKLVLDEFNKTHKLNFNLTLEHVKEDLPKLLENVPDDFDWSDPDYDSILDVYFFFITYKESALMRQVQFEKEMLASLTQVLEKVLDSAQKTTSKAESLTDTPSI